MADADARDAVLVMGLVDWVPLERVHYEVSKANPDAPLREIQTKVVQLVDTLVGEGMFVLGELAENGARFAPWDAPQHISMHRLREAYIDNFDDQNLWQWFCWLDLTDKGEQVAVPLEADLNSRHQQSRP